MHAKTRLGAWFKRYGPPEVAGTILAVGGLHAAHVLGFSEVTAAYIGAMAENIGFYGVVLIRELRDHAPRGALTRMLVEFGPAEVLDTFVIRPLAMGLGAHWLGDLAGALLGKLLADVLFYIPVIVTYEWRNR
jgi:hypothetical protein